VERYAKARIDVRDRQNGHQRSTATASACVLGDGTAIPYDKLAANNWRPAHGSCRARPTADASPRFAATTMPRVFGRYLVDGSHIAILGGGFIGLELAASARKLGATVTLVEGLPRVLSRGVPAEIAAIVAGRHVAEGVEMLCGAKVAGIEELPGEVRIALEDGRVVSANLLVVGIGAVPNTELAEAAGPCG
jgi:3-phenylpropionate/trans-cinnamate dioxygenase ferredoxin reductase subunit